MSYFQSTATNWPQWVAKFPANFSVFAVDRGDILRDARAARPGIFTILRHWNDNYPWSDDWETNKAFARQWFDTFVDGTFREQYAPHVMAVTERNEYDSHVLPAAERARRIKWMQAVSWVWNVEYKAQLQQYRPGLPPIQLVIGENAVGNDLPREAAVVAIDGSDLLGYHPYMAVYSPTANQPVTARNLVNYIRPNFRQGELTYIVPGASELATFGMDALGVGDPSPNEWQWASGRWHYMEQSWGLKPTWVFGEFGPIRDASGTGWLQPNDGWRHSGVCGGDVDKLLALMDYWLGHAKATAAYQEGRIRGFHFFTTPGDPPWQLFKFQLPEMDTIANWVNLNWKPGTAPPPPPPEPPRTWAKTVILAPQGTTPSQYDVLQAVAYPTKTEIAFSADSAFARPANVTTHKVIVYDVAQWGGQAALDAWVAQHYQYSPATVVEYRAWPSPVGWPWPVANATHSINFPFGEPRDYDGDGNYDDRHEGADIYAQTGNPIVAVMPGQVVWASDKRRSNPAQPSAYGWHVIIAHEGELYETWYCHCSLLVSGVGDNVGAGDLIAYAGSSGNSTGPHLHFNVRKAGHYAGPGFAPADVVDPAPYLQQ